MNVRCITNIAKTMSKALPESKNAIAKCARLSDSVTDEAVTTLERSPKVDGFVKNITESTPHSVSTNTVTKVENIIPLNRESS